MNLKFHKSNEINITNIYIYIYIYITGNLQI